jgi:hypothetical protein
LRLLRRDALRSADHQKTFRLIKLHRIHVPVITRCGRGRKPGLLRD